MGRTILLGEARAREMDGLDVPAFSSKSGRFLSGLLGVDVREVFDTGNLLDYWPGKAAKGSAFPIQEAREAAVRFAKGLDQDQRVIVAGMRAANAVGIGRLKYFEWGKLAGMNGRWAIIPHPSGVNRFWNEIANREQCRNFLIHEIQRMFEVDQAE